MKDKQFSIEPIGFQWTMEDPYIFCAHHQDNYPNGNENMEAVADLTGRNLGNDFSGKDGFSMYHGRKVPGFPVHPHRGFETVTIVLDGYVDHFDSKGAAGRYGQGDVQWLTTGAGCQHTEMFPCINQDKNNTLDLFQIWLNLPSKDKFVEPDYKMLWAENIPVLDFNGVTLRLIAGTYAGYYAPDPAPGSWAAKKENKIGIYLIDLPEGGRFTLEKQEDDVVRNIYYFKGESMTLNGITVASGHRIRCHNHDNLEMVSFGYNRVLILEGKPIGEPVVAYGPFVMNTTKEIEQAIADYQRTGFGGWPWPSDAPVHSLEQGRFAMHLDGRKEYPK